MILKDKSGSIRHVLDAWSAARPDDNSDIVPNRSDIDRSVISRVLSDTCVIYPDETGKNHLVTFAGQNIRRISAIQTTHFPWPCLFSATQEDLAGSILMQCVKQPSAVAFQAKLDHGVLVDGLLLPMACASRQSPVVIATLDIQGRAEESTIFLKTLLIAVPLSSIQRTSRKSAAKSAAKAIPMSQPAKQDTASTASQPGNSGAGTNVTPFPARTNVIPFPNTR